MDTQNYPGGAHRTLPKVGSWLDAFEANARMAHTLTRELAIDEQTIGHKGRWTSLTHMNKHKPAGQGFKLYSVNESSTGYTYAIHLDRKNDVSIGTIVVELAAKLAGTGHHVYMDNLFAKPATIRRMRELPRPQYACGTWRSNFGVPPSLKTATLKERGDMAWRTDESGLLGYAWLDSGKCYMLSSIHTNPQAVGTVLRRERGQSGRTAIKAPMAAVDYNNFMAAVDKCDQMRGTYSTQRRTAKWWMPLFTWTLDAAAVNCYGVHCSLDGTDASVHDRREKFQRALVIGLLRQGGVVASFVHDAGNCARPSPASMRAPSKVPGSTGAGRDTRDTPSSVKPPTTPATPHNVASSGKRARCQQCLETHQRDMKRFKSLPKRAELQEAYRNSNKTRWLCTHPDCEAQGHFFHWSPDDPDDNVSSCFAAWHNLHYGRGRWNGSGSVSSSSQRTKSSAGGAGGSGQTLPSPRA